MEVKLPSCTSSTSRAIHSQYKLKCNTCPLQFHVIALERGCFHFCNSEKLLSTIQTVFSFPVFIFDGWSLCYLFLADHLTADLQFFPGNEFDESRRKLNTRHARYHDNPPSFNPNRHQEPLFDDRLKNRNSTPSYIAASYHKRLSISWKVVGRTYRPPHYGRRGAHKYVETVA